MFSAPLHWEVAEWRKTRKPMEVEGEKCLRCSQEHHLLASCSGLWVLPPCFTGLLPKMALIAQQREEYVKLV